MRRCLLAVNLLVLLTSVGCFGLFAPDRNSLVVDNTAPGSEFKSDPDFGKTEVGADSATAKAISGAQIYADFDSVHIEMIVGKAYESCKGAGFPVSVGGQPYVLTAGHNCFSMAKYRKVFVYFKNSCQSPEEAEFAVGDPNIDWALLRFKKPGFAYQGKYPKLGLANGLVIGEAVFSIGSSSGTEHSFKTGIVEQIICGRNNGQTQPRLIIHSCQLEPGNSGGPLLNSRGEVVGINVMANMSKGIAVPIDDVIASIRRVKKGGKFEHPYLDFLLMETKWLNEADYTERLKVPTPGQSGLVVYVCDSSSSIAKAGLKLGDLVLECAGVEAKDSAEVYRHLMLDFDPGDEVEFKVLRGKEKLTFKIQLE